MQAICKALGINRQTLVTMLVVFALLVVSVASVAAQSSSTITIDTGAFILGINTWLPMAISIIVIGVGIAGAFALARFVGRMIVDAFDGKI